jgi:translation initiation factor 2 alpha subunit (eIF-2alpha)
MAEKTLSVKLSLNDKQFQSSLKKATRSMKKFGKNLQKTGQNLSRNLTLPIIAFGAASVKAFDDQVKAETKLRTSLKGNEEAFARLAKQARELQKETLFGDEATIEAQSFLAQLGLNEQAILKLTPLIQDFATAQGIGLTDAAKLVAKSVGSSTNALSRYGIQIDGAVGSADRLDSAVGALSTAFGGQAKAIAKEGLGPLTQLKNELGDVSEEFGKLVLDNIEPLKRSLQGLAERLRNLTPAQKENIVQFAKYAALIGPALIVLGKIVTVVSSLAKALGTLTLATGLAGAAATALVGIMGFAILDTERFIKTALQMGKVGKFIAKVVLGALSAVSPKYAAYFAVIDEVGESLDEQEKKLKDSTTEIDKNKDAVDNLNEALQNLNTTQQGGVTDAPNGIPQRIEPKKTGLITGFEVTTPAKITETATAVDILGSSLTKLEQIGLQLEDTFVNAFNSMQEGAELSFKSIGKVALNAARDVVKAKLSEAIATQIAKILISVPFPLNVGIAAGAGAAVGGIFNKAIPAFADGGIVSGPTVGLMGEYAGANTNPEVIAPLNKLKDMIGGQTVQVQGMISGEDIFLSNDRYSRRKNSY